MVRPKGLSAAAEPTAPRGSSPVALLELFPAAAPVGIVPPDVLALRLELLRRSFGYLRPELDDHVFTVEVEFETSFEASSRRKSRADPSSCVKRRDVGCTTALEIVIGLPPLSRFGGRATRQRRCGFSLRSRALPGLGLALRLTGCRSALVSPSPTRATGRPSSKTAQPPQARAAALRACGDSLRLCPKSK